MMRVYDGIMLESELRKEVLIQFGFGEVSPVEVEKYIRKKYPMKYKEIKTSVRNINKIYNDNNLVNPFKVETMSREERNVILDSVTMD